MKLTSSFLLGLLAYCAIVASPLAATLSPGLNQFVATKFPEHEPEETASSDLDGDGTLETAILLGAKDNMQRLLVLRETGDGSVAQLSVSKAFVRCMHGYELSMKKKSLFLLCFHGGASQPSVHTSYQFSIRKGRLRLVGQEYSVVADPDDPASAKSLDTYESINYLTGGRIETRKSKGHTLNRKLTKLSASEQQPKFLENFEP